MRRISSRGHRRVARLALMLSVAILVGALTPEALAAPPTDGVPAFTWSHNLSRRWLPRPLLYRYPAGLWLREIDWMLAENGSAGLHFSGFYALPFRIPDRYLSEPASWRTDATLQRHYAASGLVWDVATEAGLYAGRISPLDPSYVAHARTELTTAATATRDRPYVSVYEGLDEPRLRVPRTPYAQWPAWFKTADQEIREAYGYGRYSAPRPLDPAYSADPDKPFRWIAFNRWAFDRFLAQRAALRTTLRSIDASATYAAADLGFIKGMPAFDFSRWGSVADLVEADPYMSYLERFSRGRGRYNHGFAAKLLSDLGGRPVRIIVQAFPYHGYTPSGRDLDDWTSQALLGGADMISYYAVDNPRFTKPVRYVSLLALGRELKEVRSSDLEVPRDERLLVLWSAATAFSRSEQPRGDAQYSAYVLLGPRVKSRFRFVSDTQLERGDASLASAKVVLLPEARYLPAAVATDLADWTAAGGTLVVGDPWAFQAAPDGSPLAGLALDVLGTERGNALWATYARVPLGSLPPGHWLTSLAGTSLPLHPLATEDGLPQVPARTLPDVSGASSITVLARYAGGGPAIIERPFGAGKVLFLAGSPFTPLGALSPTWRAFFAALLEREGLWIADPTWDRRLTTRWSRTLRLSLARRVLTVRRGGTLRVDWRATNTPATRAALTALVRLPRGRMARMELGWAPTGRWVFGSTVVRLPPGRYPATMHAVSLTAACTPRGYPVTLVVR